MPERSAKKPSALAGKLRKLGLVSDIDFVLHFPLRYEDETRLQKISDAQIGEPAQIEVSVTEVEIQFRPRRQLVVYVVDGEEGLMLRFFNFYPSQIKQFQGWQSSGKKFRIFGELREGYLGLEMLHPRYRAVGENDALPQALTPVYPTTAGLGQASLRKLIASALINADLSEILNLAWCEEQHFPSFRDAVLLLHTPPPETLESALQERTHLAWQRIKFDELLTQQLSLRRAYRARRAKGAPSLTGSGALARQLLAALPFALTKAQRRVLDEISIDLQHGFPMQRLLQGDVGSGKTIVAALAACQAIEAGYQAALMAPTEILAEQHYAKLKSWFEPLGIRIAWLSGSLKKSTKLAMQHEAATTTQFVVGTHALIQDGVDFARLGLAIIDEQHRFGVEQRLELRRKGGNPHQLMMSATPIPRTLAMSYYADLDVSVIDELPPGRKPIRTKLLSQARRDEVIMRIRAAAQTGRQAYWVCPLIEESETLDLQTAIDTHALLTDELGGLSVGLIHGRLKADQKAEAMAAFSAGEIDVLVATTVIEVGVDVPNASLMVIEHAERFGLSQLHQLRGRIGRGSDDSVCVLLYYTPLSELARARLKIIFEQTNGFEIARQDLHLRGPGEFVGSRQSGVPLLRYADLERDADLIELARKQAEILLANAPNVAEKHLERWLGNRDDWLKA